MSGQRVTVADLEAIVRRINRTVNGTDETPVWYRDESGLHQNAGVFHLSGAYGGYALHRNCREDVNGESHGVQDVLQIGHAPKRELQAAMFAFLRGMEVATDDR